MAAFPLPSNNPSAPMPRIGSSEQTSVNIAKTSFEANYLQVRRTSSRSRRAFDLNYDAITLSEYELLESFFLANVGNVFTFTHPISNIEYTVTFKEGTISKKYRSYNIYDSSITLESI
jgi:hypothetical protein